MGFFHLLLCGLVSIATYEFLHGMSERSVKKQQKKVSFIKEIVDKEIGYCIDGTIVRTNHPSVLYELLIFVIGTNKTVRFNKDDMSALLKMDYDGRKSYILKKFEEQSS